MLTDQAYHERKWGDYPFLDQLLSGNKPSMQWTGPTSVSSTIFTQVEDLLSVYALVDDQFEEIRQLSNRAENDSLYRDLRELSQRLDWMSEFFKDASHKVRNI